MPVFEYKGFDGSGGDVKGIVDADSAKSARTKLRKQGVFPTDIHEQEAGRKTRGSGLATEVDLEKYFQRINTQDIATMTTQLATLVGASIPLVEALSAILDQTEKAKLKVVLADVREKVNEGAGLAQAMGNHPKVFNDLYVNMVAAGEQSGSLDVVLDRLAVYMESMVKLRGKIIAAMIYPALMAIVGVLLLVVIFIVVIPKMRKLFDGFGEVLPAPTRLLLWGSETVAAGWWVMLIIGAVAFFLFRRWTQTEKGRRKWHSMLLTMPIAGRVNRIVATTRFCRTLATLLVSGVPILTAMSIVQRVVSNDVMAEAIESATKNIREGQSIAQPLKESGEFPSLVTHMIAIGERTGDLEPMLEKVSSAYEAESERTFDALTALLEPLLILVMGGTLGFVAVALLLPLLQMSNLSGA